VYVFVRFLVSVPDLCACFIYITDSTPSSAWPGGATIVSGWYKSPTYKSWGYSGYKCATQRGKDKRRPMF